MQNGAKSCLLQLEIHVILVMAALHAAHAGVRQHDCRHASVRPAPNTYSRSPHFHGNDIVTGCNQPVTDCSIMTHRHIIIILLMSRNERAAPRRPRVILHSLPNTNRHNHVTCARLMLQVLPHCLEL
jgi:hypothetical protein